MTGAELINMLIKGIDQSDAITVTHFPIKVLSITNSDLNQVLWDIGQKRGSRSEGPVEIMYNIEKDQFIITDGYHRVVEYILKRMQFIPAKVWSTKYSDYYADAKAPLYIKPDDIRSFPVLNENRGFGVKKHIKKSQLKQIIKEILSVVLEKKLPTELNDYRTRYE